ncbi:MAG: hypothetical protein QM811_03615 [Pirellulales bacterium]
MVAIHEHLSEIGGWSFYVVNQCDDMIEAAELSAHRSLDSQVIANSPQAVCMGVKPGGVSLLWQMSHADEPFILDLTMRLGDRIETVVYEFPPLNNKTSVSYVELLGQSGHICHGRFSEN